ncbi:MAG TPA: type ISP restriction/modification enzyme [Burkholderiales bacterium]
MPMNPLASLLKKFRDAARSEREKGSYFEKLVKVYLLNEPYYSDLYGGKVWLWEEWRPEWIKRGNADPGADAGIDLVAETISGELHAIQAKFFADDARLHLDDLSTFFTASSKRHFAHRLIFLTATDSTHHLREAVKDQYPPVSLVTLLELEASKIDWASFEPGNKNATLKEKKSLRPHQVTAVEGAVTGLAQAPRGKLIMACGTGKTFTSLRLAEKLAGEGKRVLFLVPSLNLLSQTLTEWTQEAEIQIHSYAVCSDTDVGKRRKSVSDDFEMLAHELQYPATTEPDKLAKEVLKGQDARHMGVVFSTYHSIDVIHLAQKEHGLANFDLIICDEAHRTTGATFDDQDESNFVRVHDAEYISGTKRLYMTATPRIYGDTAKASAERDNVALCSMDDERLYGKELHVLTFSEAVRRGLLVDYKVIVLAVEEAHVNRRLQSLLRDEDNQLKVDDAAKIIGCWKALSKQGLAESLAGDSRAMRRAVAFCQVIEITKAGKTHKVSSKQIASMFKAVVDAYQEQEDFEQVENLTCEAEHVDGGMNAGEKEEKLAWLKAEAPENTCRILSNVRCLSEGVDVPALDAVLFLTPRNSQVDVVQSVGRVMRNAPGKERGYVILPVVIPAGVEPHEALNDNKTYAVVWQVLQALRSHDDRFDAMVNKLDLIGQDTSKMEIVAITDKIQKRQQKGKGATAGAPGKGGFTIGEAIKRTPQQEQTTLEFEIGEIERAIYAKLVQKVGNRHHWEEWANDIAKIARTHIDRIKAILESPKNFPVRKSFDVFASKLRGDLNDSISDDEIVEMLAQHLITKPVFDALFEGYSFAQHNPMSQAMQSVLDVLQEHHLDKEADTLQSFYDSVRMRAEGIDNAAGKQKIVVELYDKFFRNAFPKMSERLGIVYTPVEVVDFIIHSIGHVLQTEFGQTLGSKGVHILDPFTGTGTFITRLIHSGLIEEEELHYKYKNEIHANEIVLLAYYIAAINIEATYHGRAGGKYVPFEGICLADTFQLYEKDDLVSAATEKNGVRRQRQKDLDIRVIMSNPPYSVGQRSENDNNDNISYSHLDSRIRSSYVERSKAVLAKGLYDSYVRAIRWASDRVGDRGVIGFVTNGNFLETGTFDGLRKCLAEEFSDIYIFHLRGNARTVGEFRRKEKDNVFGMGSRAPIAISILVKNPSAAHVGRVHFSDIGDYLTRDEKLSKINSFVSIKGIEDAGAWRLIEPDEHGDWLKQRDQGFTQFIAIGDKTDNSPAIFENFSLGVITNRDAWCYNSSKDGVVQNMSRMINFFNDESSRFSLAFAELSKKEKEYRVDGFINNDPVQISWTRSLKQELVKAKCFEFDRNALTVSMYRPFTKQWMYFNRRFNEMVYQMPRLFPDAHSKNLVICINAVGSQKEFSTLISDCLPDLHLLQTGQYFPLYLYEEQTGTTAKNVSLTADLFYEESAVSTKWIRRHAIGFAGIDYFGAAYPGAVIGPEDIFFYVYGILHSQDYRERYADNLVKELPRIPRVRSVDDFWRFSKGGRALADLHLNYEKAEIYPLKALNAKVPDDEKSSHVEKMRYGKIGKGKDLTTIHYNDSISLTGIPLEAFEYVVNGKPALDWVVERQSVRIDKDSGIVNDANDWARETMNNPRYPLELFQRVITVSLETMKIVKGLPRLSDLI